MDGHDFRGQTVIDYGCGSGVLGIVAAIKGAAKVICVDNDPQALLATRDNAARNGAAGHVQVLNPGQFNPAPADVVLANILAGPLVELAPVLLASLRPGGSLVLSGILEEQADEVAVAYRAQVDALTVTADDGWVRLSALGSVQ
jgi:ribosomal protein L11 methyltransferase